jgi:hypothetical protein
LIEFFKYPLFSFDWGNRLFVRMLVLPFGGKYVRWVECDEEVSEGWGGLERAGLESCGVRWGERSGGGGGGG